MLLNLKKLRIEKNITQNKLAQKLNTTVRTYQYIEYGQRKPSYDVILKLQEIFDCDISYLLSKSNNAS